MKKEKAFMKKSTVRKDYKVLHALSKNIAHLSGVFSLIEWDQETYMPENAIQARSEELEILAGMIHEKKTSKTFQKSLEKLIDLKSGKILQNFLTPREKKALLRWRRDFIHEIALPKSFVEEFASLVSQSRMAWSVAKKENRFQDFLPFLKKIIELSRKKADLLKYKEHPYDALLDEFEPGSTTRGISKEFDKVKQPIQNLLKTILEKKAVDNHFLLEKFSPDLQLSFGKEILSAMGFFSKKMGRVDFSSHPFTSSAHPSDCRITTKVGEKSLMNNISVMLHEGGHALYEMGLSEKDFGSPLGQAVSLAVHESQSRFWEIFIGQSKPFWSFYFPKLQKTFKKLKKVSLEEFYAAINKVQPSLIRVDADEVTYPLHVILRFEMEKSLIEGKLKAENIPEAWNEKMFSLLNITPKTDTEGCLQDIHWAMGSFGYFPSYLLGTMYAAHLFNHFTKTHSLWKKRVLTGDLLFIRDWLHDNIYRYGREYDSLELLKKATKTPFTSESFIQYLEDKYREIYR